MGWRLESDRRTTEQLTAGGIGMFIGAGLTLLFAWSAGAFDDPDPRQVYPAEIDAAVVVDATTIEMHGYGPDGKVGTFLYDCERAGEGDGGVVVEEGEEPTLVCTQREAAP